MGDGTEVLTDSDETEAFDHEEEDRDLDSQVVRGQPSPHDTDQVVREATPGPETPQKQQLSDSTNQNFSEPSAMDTTGSPDASGVTNSKVIPESALPDKIVASPSNEEK